MRIPFAEITLALVFLTGCASETRTAPPPTTATLPGSKPAPPPVDFETRKKRSYEMATKLASLGDLHHARELLEGLVPEASEKTDSDSEFWLHNELTWIRWSEGDLQGALAEVDGAKGALDRSEIDVASKKKLKLHELWDRAYVDLEISLAAPPENRDALYSKADDARNEYQELALVENDHDGMAVLEAFFAVRKGDGNHAKLAAKKVDVEQDSDLQDLYVIALALDLGGDAEGAQNVRARICSGHEYLMKPLILRQMAKEGHACPTP